MKRFSFAPWFSLLAIDLIILILGFFSGSYSVPIGFLAMITFDLAFYPLVSGVDKQWVLPVSVATQFARVLIGVCIGCAPFFVSPIKNLIIPLSALFGADLLLSSSLFLLSSKKQELVFRKRKLFLRYFPAVLLYVVSLAYMVGWVCWAAISLVNNPNYDPLYASVFINAAMTLLMPLFALVLKKQGAILAVAAFGFSVSVSLSFILRLLFDPNTYFVSLQLLFASHFGVPVFLVSLLLFLGAKSSTTKEVELATD